MQQPHLHSLTTSEESETEALGAALAALLPRPAVIALHGDLAAGKTALVRGLARALGFEGAVNSPTFTLINQYGDAPPLYHLDLYRLDSLDELAELGIEDLFDQGLCAIEWAERAGRLLPEQRIEIRLEHAGADLRSIEIENRGLLADGWQDALSFDRITG